MTVPVVRATGGRPTEVPGDEVPDVPVAPRVGVEYSRKFLYLTGGGVGEGPSSSCRGLEQGDLMQVEAQERLGR